MKTKTINIYQFSELNDKAKEKAKDDAKNIVGFCWNQEYINSINALAKHFGGVIENYRIYWDRSKICYVTVDMPIMLFDEINDKLSELGDYNKETLQGLGECKLTGFCADEEAIDGFRTEFFKVYYKKSINYVRPLNILEDLIRHAFINLVKAGQKDYEHLYSDKQFSLDCFANGYWFTEDGTLTSEK